MRISMTHQPENTLLSALSIWISGWAIFALIEILMRVITVPWAGTDSVTVSCIALLSVVAYSLFGILTSVILHTTIRFLSVSGFHKLRQMRRDCFHIALCITTMIFVYALFFIDERFIPHSSRVVAMLYYSGLLCVLLIVFLTIYRIFATITHKSRIVITYLVLTFSLNLGMAIGLHGTRSLIPDLFPRNDHTKPDDKTNVILIVMDTTRRDHLSCYGYTRETTPHLDSLARDSLLFTNAYSPSSWTLPAHASIMTGLYPSTHGSHYNVNSTSTPAVNILHDRFTTLAEILSQNGYKTAGVVGATFCHRFFGIAQGFNYYSDERRNTNLDLDHYCILHIASKFLPLKKYFFLHGHRGIRRASELNKILFPWLGKNHGYPFFLFINYFDAHWPYSPPTPYDTLYEGKNYQAIRENYASDWNLFSAIIKKNHTLTDKEKNHLLSQYDGEITYLDYHIGKLMEKLKALKLYDESMIIITSDHGESFGEHNLMDHGRALYEELLQIPLIIKYPSSHKKIGRCGSQASLIDIMPAVLATAGISLPENIQGTVITGEKDNRILYAESFRDKLWIEKLGSRFDRDLLTIHSGDFKYIWASNGAHELYNIKKDPKEAYNLINEMPEIAADMHEKVQDKLAIFKSSRLINESPQVGSEIKEKLRALGYTS